MAVKSAERTIDLLEFLADATDPPHFTAIAAALGIPKSSLSQLLGNLVNRGYVQLDGERGVYHLGERVQRLAQRATGFIPLQQIINRSLERIRDAVNESAAFYVRRDDEVEVVAAITSRHSLVYTMTIGDRAPLYGMSAGKVVLGQMGAAELSAYLQRVRPQPLTRNTIVTKAGLRAEAGKVKRMGIAFACEEFQLGIRGAAVPVLVAGRFVGALNVAVPVTRYDEALDLTLRTSLPAAAAEIGTALSRHDLANLDAAIAALKAGNAKRAQSA